MLIYDIFLKTQETTYNNAQIFLRGGEGTEEDK